ARGPRCMTRSDRHSGGWPDTRSIHWNRPGSVAILLLAEPFGADPFGNATVGAQRAFGDEKDHAPLVQDGDAHPRTELQSLTSSARHDELVLGRQRHGLHRLTKRLSIRC